jgi:hypothetical protein
VTRNTAAGDPFTYNHTAIRERNDMSFIDQIMAYEDGELSELETLDLFAGLIRDGICWQLQGSYGRTAASLIDAGLISPEGDLLV